MSNWRGATTYRGILAVCLGMSLLSATSSAAGEEGATIARAQELIQSFEYDMALEMLDTIVFDRETTAHERVEALELMGVLHFNLDRQPRARQMFERLLNLDPGHELTDTSYPPRLISFYESIQDSFTPQISIDIAVDAFQDPPESGNLVIEATLSGNVDGVAEAVAHVRSAGEAAYRRAVMARQGNDFSAEISLQSGDEDVEIFVEVTAPSGHVLAHNGSADAPLEVSADAAPGSPYASRPDGSGDNGEEGEEPRRERRRWYASWWFWTIVSVAIAGGVATAIVFAWPEEQQEGTLGTRSLP